MYFWQKLGTKCITKCKSQGPSANFWKARDQIQHFGQPQGPSMYFTQNKNKKIPALVPRHNIQQVIQDFDDVILIEFLFPLKTPFHLVMILLLHVL
ncbi:hypothetical protein HanRHA438_Chr10g0440401 [Helianthus annuus]|nr:hypothetical protein HanRHA438_Chr10g0440401 [Helianthus annuus]